MSLQQKFYCESRYPDKMPENVHGQNARKWKTEQNAVEYVTKI